MLYANLLSPTRRGRTLGVRSVKRNCESATVVDLSPLKDAIRETASVFRRHRLSYDQIAYVVKQARRSLDIGHERPAKRLPRNLSAEELSAFFSAIERGGDASHQLLFRLMFFTGLRVSELTAVTRLDVELAERTIRVNLGKGAKDRVVLYPDHLQLALRLHMESNPGQRYLFESRRRERLSSRWIQLLASKYGVVAHIERMHPHRLRHTLLTDLTKAGLTDAQIQLISGHSTKKSLEVYQSLALSDVKDDYGRAMSGR
jgi:integrase/recombinase XerD